MIERMKHSKQQANKQTKNKNQTAQMKKNVGEERNKFKVIYFFMVFENIIQAKDCQQIRFLSLSYLQHNNILEKKREKKQYRTNNNNKVTVQQRSHDSRSRKKRKQNIAYHNITILEVLLFKRNNKNNNEKLALEIFKRKWR